MMIDRAFRIFRTSPSLQLLACFICGLIAALAMAPTHSFLALCVGYSGYLITFYYSQERLASRFMLFISGCLFGFGYFLINLNWIGNALLIDGNDYAWAYPFAVAGLPFALSFFYGVGALVLSYFSVKKISGYLAAILIFASLDWLRGHILTGFPWNLPVHALAEDLEILQILSAIDLYSLNFLVLSVCCLGVLSITISSRMIKMIIVALPLIILTVFYLFGLQRLSENSTVFRDDYAIHIVQPNILQSEKWNRGKMPGHFKSLIQLSRDDKENTSGSKLIVWPETAINTFTMTSKNREKMKEVLNKHQSAYLITGLLTYDADVGYGNSTTLIDLHGHTSNVVNKSKLVPFGEFMPFQDYIPISPIANFQGFNRGNYDFSRSIVEKNTKNRLTYSSLICYEILFPNLKLQKNEENLDMIVNVTNDAWYGDSAGPRQHLWHARYRAIEHGLPVIRSANTGISAVFDSYGRIVTYSPFGVSSTLKTQLPVRGNVLIKNKTWIFGSFIFGFIILILLRIQNESRQHKP